jgi:uncharacterized integral membrane protein
MRLLRENLAKCAQFIKIISVTFALLFASMLWSTICHIEWHDNLVIFKTTLQIITTVATASKSMYFSYVATLQIVGCLQNYSLCLINM